MSVYFTSLLKVILIRISEICKRFLETELGQDFIEEAGTYLSVLDKLTIDTSQNTIQPEVIFRVNENTWIELIVRYPVEPLKASKVKTLLIGKLLAEFNASKLVLFPEGAGR